MLHNRAKKDFNSWTICGKFLPKPYDHSSHGQLSRFIHICKMIKYYWEDVITNHGLEIDTKLTVGQTDAWSACIVATKVWIELDKLIFDPNVSSKCEFTQMWVHSMFFFSLFELWIVSTNFHEVLQLYILSVSYSAHSLTAYMCIRRGLFIKCSNVHLSSKEDEEE